ncbi:hypothetical protein GQ457_12G031240 [Hibiscus cannabinus]
MGCLCSVFDVKKQGKPIRKVRTRNWKLREGENRLLGLLESISMTWGRQGGKEDQGITFVQVRFCGYGSMYKQLGGYALFGSVLDSFDV